jgi:lysylphosphatidylglycerol synthetase-like protein (DUF2156 family)
MEKETPELKRPLGVVLLAIFFLLAPIGNILISFAGSGIEGWYKWDVISAFLQTMPVIEWVWLGLLFLTGILMLKAHKLSWTLAIVSLLIILLINIYRAFNIDQNSIEPGFLKVFAVAAFLCTIGVLVIAVYFRYPYLDRRTKWTSSEPSSDRRLGARSETSERRKS